MGVNTIERVHAFMPRAASVSNLLVLEILGKSRVIGASLNTREESKSEKFVDFD